MADRTPRLPRCARPRLGTVALLTALVAAVGCASDDDENSEDAAAGTDASSTAAVDDGASATTAAPDTTTPITTVEPATSAASTASTSSTTITTSPSASTSAPTTSPATTTPPSTTDPEDGAGSLALIDLEDASLAGWPFGDGDLIVDLTAVLGEPVDDSGWLPMTPKLACTGNLDYREYRWGDLRVVAERADLGQPARAESWSLGVATASIAPASRYDELEPATGITTVDGIGIRDPVTDIDIDNMFGQVGPNEYGVAGSRAITITTTDDGVITGFASGRNDCIGLDISTLPCERPLPVFRLPDGSQTGQVSIDEGNAFWGLEQGVGSENIVSEDIGGAGPDDDFVQIAYLALSADSAGQVVRNGPLQLVVVPTADPPVGGATLVLFDDRTDCIRTFRTSTGPDGIGLELGELEDYAEVLVTDWYPQR